MAKNQSSLRMRNQVIILILGIYISACSSTIIKEPYYRYSIGEIEIDNPVFVSFIGTYFPDDLYAFVCPDSALYDCTSPKWKDRPDVYPYIEYGDLRDEMFSCFNSPKLPNQYPSTFYTTFFHKLKIWPHFAFHPFEDSLEHCYEVDNYTVCYEKFCYGITHFDCYLQAVDAYWYDSHNFPIGTNPEADCLDLDSFTFSPIYRMAIRGHYTPWQMIKLYIRSIKRKNAIGFVEFVDSQNELQNN